MADKPKAYQVAARLYDAAEAVRNASHALDAAYSILLNYAGEGCDADWYAIEGLENIDRRTGDALERLSDKYQAIADAEPESAA